MSEAGSEVRTLRARKAAIVRHHPDTDTSEITRDLRCAHLADHVRSVVDGFPPLTHDQRSTLAALLAPPAGEST